MGPRYLLFIKLFVIVHFEPAHEILVFIEQASSNGPDEPVHLQGMKREEDPDQTFDFFVCLFHLILYVPSTIFQL